MARIAPPPASAWRGLRGRVKRLALSWEGGVAAALLVTARLAAAEELALPAQVEANLSGNVAAYDRALVDRAGTMVVIAIVARASDPDSMHAALQMQAAFRELHDIGGLPHEEFIVIWKDGATLSEACMRRKASIVFLAPGLGGDIDAIVNALKDLRVLSVAGALGYVIKGAVLGFDLVSGRPKLVINLPMAKQHGLQFRASLLKLARVIE
jgi:YfiR/HmsC-like